MRTIAYVDGYNLFYSILSKTSYKWLDLFTLFDHHIIPDICPGAPALGSLSKDPMVQVRQAKYHRALRVQGKIETIEGYHQPAITTGVLVDPPEGADPMKKVRVRVMEEKQTDVNIGLHMYRDVLHGNCDHIILCSNDADLAPALKMIRRDCPDVVISVVLPRKPGSKARLSEKLLAHAHNPRRSINEEELAASQHPHEMTDKRRRTFKCPEEWL